MVPGLLLLGAAVVVWAIGGEGSDATRWIVVAVSTAIAVTGVILAAILPGRRAAAAGAPRSLMWVVALGTVVGFFVIPIVGALVGGPAAAYGAEYLRLRDSAAARRSAIEALKGFGIGVALQLLAGVTIAAVWAVGVIAT